MVEITQYLEARVPFMEGKEKKTVKQSAASSLFVSSIISKRKDYSRVIEQVSRCLHMPAAHTQDSI